MDRLRRIILVPGLFEPRSVFWPLKWMLNRRCEHVEVFRDRRAIRDVDESVRRLAGMLAESSEDRSVALVTHSFGDWVARQAVARTAQPHVDALVSIAPVMRAGLFAKGLHVVSGNLIPASARHLGSGGRMCAAGSAGRRTKSTG